ncbi:MAG: hypothetical protein RLZZ301_997 [Bacteroidota bacterium]
MIKRVIFSNKAIELLALLKKEHSSLMFHQSGGCCDGSQPMCFEAGEFYIGSSDVCLGKPEGIEFWMSQDQFDYWKHTQLCIDVVQGRGSSFSLEIPLGVRFIVRSRLFSPSELLELEPISYKVD